uniref:NADH-ubiquinone oxidoreductase chain 4 n=1 Tax=Isoetes engelmannii TaxID=37427 RepID=C6FGP7_ISOEN|nr:NADH dehydrogenase subunit 4 [Isoetes engelmannii]ACI95888.1 NADH dehydrogenase subunit 4 [Isoetes engelmannii]
MLESLAPFYSNLGGPIPCPPLGSTILFVIPDSRIRLIRSIGLCTSLITSSYPPFFRVRFDNSTAKPQPVETIRWLPDPNINFSIGIDGIPSFFVVSTTFPIPIRTPVGWSSIESYEKEYTIAFSIRESIMIAVPRMPDPSPPHVFSESVLISMSIIIGIRGSRQRKIKAAYQFFSYTSLGSVFMLSAISPISSGTGTTDVQILLTTGFSERRQISPRIASPASPPVKVPMVPVHIRSSEAYVEAPTAGFVISAGIPSKLGTHGFSRFNIPTRPVATPHSTPFIYTPSVIAIIHTPPTTIRQIDLKKNIAYSSVAHMNFGTIGMFSLNVQGIEGSILLMLSHGLVSSALFLCVGALYDRHRTRLVKHHGGLVSTTLIPLTIPSSFTPANTSLPGTSSPIGESPVLVGASERNSLVAALAALGMILGAAHLPRPYNRVVPGNFKPNSPQKFSDSNRREVPIFLSSIVGVIWMGVHLEVSPERTYTPAGNSVQHGKSD